MLAVSMVQGPGRNLVQTRLIPGLLVVDGPGRNLVQDSGRNRSLVKYAASQLTADAGADAHAHADG